MSQTLMEVPSDLVTACAISLGNGSARTRRRRREFELHATVAERRRAADVGRPRRDPGRRAQSRNRTSRDVHARGPAQAPARVDSRRAFTVVDVMAHPRDHVRPHPANALFAEFVPSGTAAVDGSGSVA